MPNIIVPSVIEKLTVFFLYTNFTPTMPRNMAIPIAGEQKL